MIGTGSCLLPNKSGGTELICELWRPRGSPLQEATALYLGVPPTLASEEAMRPQQFSMLYTQTTGRVHIYCETLIKNFDKLSDKA